MRLFRDRFAAHIVVGFACFIAGLGVGIWMSWSAHNAAYKGWTPPRKSEESPLLPETGKTERPVVPRGSPNYHFVDVGIQAPDDGRAIPVDKEYKPTSESAVEFLNVERNGISYLYWKHRALPWRPSPKPLTGPVGTWPEGSGQYSNVTTEEVHKGAKITINITFDRDVNGALWLEETTYGEEGFHPLEENRYKVRLLRDN